jgi:hypothetical protein
VSRKLSAVQPRRLDIAAQPLYNSAVKLKPPALTEETGQMSPKLPMETNVPVDEEKARLEALAKLELEGPPKLKSRGFQPAIGVPLLLLLIFIIICGIWLWGRTHRPVLEVSSFRWGETRDGHFVEVRGQVKNISGRSLENVMAVVTFIDKSGGRITSSDAMIDDNPILPGQASSFCIIETYNPAMRTAVVEFSFLMGANIPTK